MATLVENVAQPMSQAECWRLLRSGGFTLKDAEDRIVVLRGRKARAVVAYLALHAGEPVSRDRLIKLLWADRGEAQARGSLRQALLEIRRAVPGLISSDHGHVWIDPVRLRFRDDGDSNSTDAELFDDLDGITPEFDDWLRGERSEQASEQWEALKSRFEDLLENRNGAAALPLIERMQRLDPYNEDWLRLAMRAEAQAGHPAAIQSRFHEMADLLRRELGVAMSGQTRALHDELLAELSRPAARTAPGEVAAIQERAVPALRWTATILRTPLLAAAGLAAVAAAFGLTQSARTASAEPPRVAVLPFRALGGVDTALAEGISEEVLGTLSQQRELRTVGRTSSWMFKDKAEDLRQVGRKLDVDYVVEGSVRRAGDALRVTVALVDTSDASTLWSGRFTSAAGDMQRIERAVTAAIGQRLGLMIAGSGRHTDPRAYALYIRAKALIRQRSWPGMREARDLLRQAVAIDAGFAPAWAQLGGAINFLGTWNKGSSNWRAEALAAARRAIALDPKLAEGHQMLAFIHGFETDEGRAHLRHALQLDPRNPQTVYWWAMAAERMGNFSLVERAARQSMAIDPLWIRPVEVAGSFALANGRRAEAYHHLSRVRAADPGTAVQLEMDFAREEGDLSRVVEIGRHPDNFDVVNASAAGLTLVFALRELGYVRESLLIDYAQPFERSIHLRQLPDIRTILAETKDDVGTSDEFLTLQPIVLELARTNRHTDIVTLFDRRGSVLNRLQRIEPGNPLDRSLFAGLVGQALAQTGREREAARLFHAADEAARVILGNGNVPKQVLVETAINQAIQGRKAQAIALLERAVAKGWLAYDGSSIRLDEMPWFAPLHGDPRFVRIVRTVDARRERERRETAALGLI